VSPETDRSDQALDRRRVGSRRGEQRILDSGLEPKPDVGETGGPAPAGWCGAIRGLKRRLTNCGVRAKNRHEAEPGG
jgi:hypothetical protein